MSADRWLVVVLGALTLAVLTEATIHLAAWWEARTYQPGDRAVRELRAELDDPVEFAAGWLARPGSIPR